MMTSRSGFISSVSILSVLALSCLTATPLEAKPLMRNHRQAVTGELATGLTSTGIGFNSLYEGQSPIDSYLNHYPGQYTEQTKNYNPLAIDSYMGKFEGGLNEYNPYSQSHIAGYGGLDGGLPGLGMAGRGEPGSWQGFGMGKTGTRGYPINTASRYGLKY